MSNLLNKTNVRKKTFAVLAEKRPHLVEKLTRISSEYFEKLEADVAVLIEQRVEALTSVGKTIK